MDLMHLLPASLVEQNRNAMKLLASIPSIKIDVPVMYSNLLDLAR